MANETERIVPPGVKLFQATTEAVNKWEQGRQKRLEETKIEKHGGHPRSGREIAQIQKTGSAGRGSFIAREMSSVLPGASKEFLEDFGDHINSCLQGDNLSEQLRKVGQGLETLNEEQINLAFEFHKLRQGLAQNSSQASFFRQELAKFNSASINQIPENSFLSGLFRSISNRYPDPRSIR